MNLTTTLGAIATIVTADELTEGDVVLHLGNHIQVACEPQYFARGIVFDALWLDVDSPDNIQEMCFDPAWRFELVTHIRALADKPVAA